MLDFFHITEPYSTLLNVYSGYLTDDKFSSVAGRYVLMASLHDRLGGHVMKWSKLKGQQWGGATLPLFHEGEFYNIEIKVGGNIVHILFWKKSTSNKTRNADFRIIRIICLSVRPYIYHPFLTLGIAHM